MVASQAFFWYDNNTDHRTCFSTTVQCISGKTLQHVLELLVTDDLTDTEVDSVAGGSWTRMVKDMTITHL